MGRSPAFPASRSQPSSSLTPARNTSAAAPAIEPIAKPVTDATASFEAQKPVDVVERSQATPITKTDATQQDEGELKGSQMIFPTLERESPTSSTYQSLSNSGTTKGNHEEALSVSPSSQTASDAADTDGEAFEEVSDELEVLSANESDDDDGFLTDEEYDVLDASDQETVASMN